MNPFELAPVWLIGEIGDFRLDDPRLWLFGRSLLVGLLKGLSWRPLLTIWSGLYSSLKGDPSNFFIFCFSANDGVSFGASTGNAWEVGLDSSA